ncbi:hypothetical protein E3T23_06580 [Cryobacterium cheniae]|uniref:Uncharacterized protein n=1 Tax=Cryobacterium cheniae TaxID=1259262 RepID=A0A4V6QHD1_9MICO|nr:hypothetical protein [Cryobacterium cheniae]TFC81158.1 hypothetical protein E3T23_06580 [Cryobacterium cheniae]
MAQALAPDFETGHILGLRDLGTKTAEGANGVTVNTHHERDFLPGQQVNRARIDAEQAGNELYFAVQFRQGQASPDDNLVFTDVATLTRLLKRIQAST